MKALNTAKGFGIVFAIAILGGSYLAVNGGSHEPALGQCPALFAPAGIEYHRDAADKPHRQLVCLEDSADMQTNPHIVRSLTEYHALYGDHVVPNPANTFVYRYGIPMPVNGGSQAEGRYRAESRGKSRRSFPKPTPISTSRRDKGYGEWLRMRTPTPNTTYSSLPYERPMQPLMRTAYPTQTPISLSTPQTWGNGL